MLCGHIPATGCLVPMEWFSWIRAFLIRPWHQFLTTEGDVALKFTSFFCTAGRFLWLGLRKCMVSLKSTGTFSDVIHNGITITEISFLISSGANMTRKAQGTVLIYWFPWTNHRLIIQQTLPFNYGHCAQLIIWKKSIFPPPLLENILHERILSPALFIISGTGCD